MWDIGPRVLPQVYHRHPYPQPRNKVASLVVVSAGCCSFHRCSHPIAVILTDENARQFTQRCHIVSFEYLTLEIQIKSSSGFIVLFFPQLHHPQKPLLYPARESSHKDEMPHLQPRFWGKEVCEGGGAANSSFFAPKEVTNQVLLLASGAETAV